MSELKSVSFVVPCLNEELNIDATVEAIRSAANGLVRREIILIDDCSTDGTLDRMRKLAAADAAIRVLDNPKNLGLGGSYKRGIAMAKLDYVMLVPGDNGFPPESIRRILMHAGEADIVIPYVEGASGRSASRIVISTFFTVVLNALFWLDVRYYNGTVLHKTRLLRTIDIATDSFAYQAEATIKLICRGATYIQCPVEVRDRAFGASTAVNLRNITGVLKAVLHLTYAVGPLCGLWHPTTRTERL